MAAAPPPKADELQPHPPKEQLAGVSFCITSPPPWRTCFSSARPPTLFGKSFVSFRFAVQMFSALVLLRSFSLRCCFSLMLRLSPLGLWRRICSSCVHVNKVLGIITELNLFLLYVYAGVCN